MITETPEKKATKKRGLGKNNLDALLADTLGSTHGAMAVAEPVQSTIKMNQGILNLPISQLQPGPYQPRQQVANSELAPLAESIKQQGILQPLLVKKVSHNQYDIIAGERRWRAAQMASLTEVPVIIKDVSEENAMAIALVENIQREQLNAMEQAIAFDKLMKQFSLTQAQVAEIVGKSRASVSNFLRLLALNEPVRSLLENGDIEFGHAKVILALKDDMQTQAAKIVVEQQLSVRETEQLVAKMLQKAEQSHQSGHSTSPVESAKQDPDIFRLQESLSGVLGAHVNIHHANTGKGKLVIKYSSLDELEGILEHIK